MIDGMMIPLMNCAPKLASENSCFFESKLGLDLLLAPEHLDQRVAGEGLLDLAVQFAGLFPLRDESLLRAPCDQGGDEEGQRDCDQRDQRELPVDREHQHDRAEHEQRPRDQLRQCLLQAGRMLSMSFVTRLSSSPRAFLST